ncbi:DUF1615 domain-containing protein [Zoogloea sp.]|uniref:DUF1615 domain-containing protein n=1 Tax=Zoogloea sp. TaxID=49181 RepID=UPI00261B18EA|nr:DUF1615 domain-containing protein [Zoogloea sp.]MDD3352594.1 DUF1615 domain-containing protein [Zoogloea sp.]
MHLIALAILSGGLSLLAGCASTGPLESRPSPPLPPVRGETAPQSVPPPRVNAPPAVVVPPGIVTPPPTILRPPPTASYPSEREGRTLVAGFLPEKLKDREGWATDIFSAFAALRIPPTPDNICAAIAVIEQESTFQADPVVQGLDRIVWKEIEARRQRLHLPKVLVDTALLKSSPDGRSYKARIDALRTEREMNLLFEDMISELPAGRSLLDGYNPVRTGGPMQVSVAFAEEHIRGKPYPHTRRGSIRNEVFTRKGGLYFGIAILLDYPAPYTKPLYRFADFNAGRYSSRNAAFQGAVAQLTGQALALDGDLLRYSGGAPSSEPSETLSALLRIASKLGLGKNELERDLRLEKTPQFAQSPLYTKVFALAEASLGGRLPREALPRIELKSPKIQRKLTTAWFAERVDWRHRTCLGRDRSQLP